MHYTTLHYTHQYLAPAFVQSGKPRIVDRLLNVGADINARVRWWGTPVCLCAAMRMCVRVYGCDRSWLP